MGDVVVEEDYEDGSGSGDYPDQEEDCEDMVCQGGGVCNMDLNGYAHCQCVLGRQGRHCEDSKHSS